MPLYLWNFTSVEDLKVQNDNYVTYEISQKLTARLTISHLSLDTFRRRHCSPCSVPAGNHRSWSTGSPIRDRSRSARSCTQAAPSCGRIWHSRTLESRQELTKKHNTHTDRNTKGSRCVRFLTVQTCPDHFFFKLMHPCQGLFSSFQLAAQCMPLFALWFSRMTNLLVANLERAQPVWSCPPFRKKSTWPMGMEMPKSVAGENVSVWSDCSRAIISKTVFKSKITMGVNFTFR